MNADEVRSAAAALFIDCFPLVLTDVVRAHHPVGGRQFRLLTDEAGALAPGLDDDDELTVLTSAWADLGDGPVIIRCAPAGGRFFSLTLFDSAGTPFASFGTRTGDDAGLALALADPHWEGELPHGVRARRAPGALVWLVSRIRAHSALDLAETVALAKRQSLSQLHPDPAPPPASVTTSEPPCPPCLRQVVEIAPAVFFHRLDAIVERAPEAKRKVLRPRVAALRAELGGPPPAAEWTADYVAALAGGFADAIEAIRAAAAPGERRGWRELGGGQAADDDDPLTRAAHAFARLGAPLREDLLGLACDRDDAGLPLSGEQSYTLHFPRNGLPPVQAFWRLTARPPARSDRRHGIGDRSDPVPDADGSLDILLQRSTPDASMLGNWLPLPDGRFSLVVRLFSPAAPALAGSWQMPTPHRIPGSAAGRRPRSWSPPSDAPNGDPAPLAEEDLSGGTVSGGAPSGASDQLGGSA